MDSDQKPSSSEGKSAGVLAPSKSGGGDFLEARISQIGEDLLRTVRSVVACAAGESGTAGARPQSLARSLGVDKVLTSRVLKAIRGADPIQATHRMPGPEPLRRFVRAAGRRGASVEVVSEALGAIDRFESLIEGQVGDRSLLDAILSAWVPDARREFELRRKQAAFKAMSQLRGVQASASVATVLIAPSPEDPSTLDVVWVNGLVGVHRVRPGALVKISTRRMTPADVSRRAFTLDGALISGLTTSRSAASLLIPAFCSSPTPDLNVRAMGESIFYSLGGDGFGVRSSCDLMFAEVNRRELPRYVPRGSGRKSYFFADITIPCEHLQFDVIVHEDVFAGQVPELAIYDTSFEGSASPNDSARDMDRMDLLETIEPLGTGIGRMRSSDVDRYTDLIRHVVVRTGFDGSNLRCFRTRIAYPLYGSQVTVVFRGVENPADG